MHMWIACCQYACLAMPCDGTECLKQKTGGVCSVHMYVCFPLTSSYPTKLETKTG